MIMIGRPGAAPGAAAMIAHVQMSDLQRLVVLPVAMMLFLWAASTSPDLSWRTNPAEQTTASHPTRTPVLP
ncbi:MAG TPA: hypothetical protein VGM09_28870 [Bradyrhizobium sp.]|jgi:hypothetical protein